MLDIIVFLLYNTANSTHIRALQGLKCLPAPAPHPQTSNPHPQTLSQGWERGP